MLELKCPCCCGWVSLQCVLTLFCKAQLSLHELLLAIRCKHPSPCCFRVSVGFYDIWFSLFWWHFHLKTLQLSQTKTIISRHQSTAISCYHEASFSAVQLMVHAWNELKFIEQCSGPVLIWWRLLLFHSLSICFIITISYQIPGGSFCYDVGRIYSLMQYKKQVFPKKYQKDNTKSPSIITKPSS